MSEEKENKSSQSAATPFYLYDFTDIYLKLALYSPIPLSSSEDYGWLHNLINDELIVDCYCTQCKKESVFSKGSYNYNDAGYVQIGHISNNRKIHQTFVCSRNATHTLDFFFLVRNKNFIKVGQYPSLADLAEGEATKYNQILGKDFSNFRKAIGLYAHGVGIGSFVYLRRILENLVNEAHETASKASEWDEVKYIEAKRFGEKIKLLKHWIPEFLNENMALYGILSAGIHELDEQDCKNAFPILKDAIEVILDEKLERKKREEKTKSARSRLSSLGAKLNKE